LVRLIDFCVALSPPTFSSSLVPHAMDPAEHLPVELLLRIFELAAASITDDMRWRRMAELNTLFRSLARVSHGWEEVTLPYLYADIAIKDECQADALIQTLDLHPDRAALVKKLELSHDPFGEDEPWRRNLVLYTLSRCVKLDELSLGGREGQWPDAWDAVLGECKLCIVFEISRTKC